MPTPARPPPKLGLARFMFALNVLVAGTAAVVTLRSPEAASRIIWNGLPTSRSSSHEAQLLACKWGAMAVLSALGFMRPLAFTALLRFELAYKILWFALVACPALYSGQGDVPPVLAGVFALWIVLLPAAIPWRWLFARPPTYAELKDD